MGKKLEIISHVLDQVRSFSQSLTYEDIMIMSKELERLIDNHIQEKYHINITEE